METVCDPATKVKQLRCTANCVIVSEEALDGDSKSSPTPSCSGDQVAWTNAGPVAFTLLIDRSWHVFSRKTKRNAGEWWRG